MSKKQFKILAAAALTSAIVVPVAGFEVSAATEVPGNGVYFHSADGTSKYIGAVEFASLSDAELTALIEEFGSENIHAIYDGEYLSVAGAIDGGEFKPYDNEIPNGDYTDITTGENVPVDQTPEENSIETFFYNLAA